MALDWPLSQNEKKACVIRIYDQELRLERLIKKAEPKSEPEDGPSPEKTPSSRKEDDGEKDKDAEQVLIRAIEQANEALKALQHMKKDVAPMTSLEKEEEEEESERRVLSPKKSRARSEDPKTLTTDRRRERRRSRCGAPLHVTFAQEDIQSPRCRGRSGTQDAESRYSAAGAAATGGATGGAAGFVAGGAIGAAVGVVPAFFTLGLSIPIGAAIGSGAGFVSGTALGSAIGFLSRAMASTGS